MLSNTEQVYLHSLLSSRHIYCLLPWIHIESQESQWPQWDINWQSKQTKLLLNNSNKRMLKESKKTKINTLTFVDEVRNDVGSVRKRVTVIKVCLSKYITNTGARPMTVCFTRIQSKSDIAGRTNILTKTYIQDNKRITKWQINKQIALVPSKMTKLNFSTGFWIIAENNLCDQQKFMILTCFVYQCDGILRNSSQKNDFFFWKCTHSQTIQDVDEFVYSSDLEKCSISSLAQQWTFCSEWVPSEWESKQLIKTHSSPSVNGLWSKKLCVCKKLIHHYDVLILLILAKIWVHNP